jgi:hypothetical protein
MRAPEKTDQEHSVSQPAGLRRAGRPAITKFAQNNIDHRYAASEAPAAVRARITAFIQTNYGSGHSPIATLGRNVYLRKHKAVSQHTAS